MPEIQKKYIASSDGNRIYYEVASVKTNAPVAVLIHGIGGDVDGWQFVRDLLNKAGVSTVALDVRGHGYSAHPFHAKDYKMEVLLQDIQAVIDAEKLERVILVGHSGGAVLALNFALAYQDRLRGLVLLCGSYQAPAYMRSNAMKSIAKGIIYLGALISPPDFGPWHSLYPKGKVHKEFELWGLTRTIIRNSLRSYLLVGQELMNIDLEHRLGEVTVPTLLVTGENDSIYPRAISEQMSEKIPNAYLEVIPHANHVVILNNFDETSKYIIDFIHMIEHPLKI